MAAEFYDEIIQLMRRVRTDLEFARIARAESRRTILCSPAEVDRIRWHVDQSGLDDILEVLESPFVPEGQIYVMDRQAINAMFNETMASRRLI